MKRSDLAALETECPPMTAEPVYIYALVDPESGEARYIGKSTRPTERLRNHINEPSSRCHRSHWVQALKARGIEPEMVVLERVEGEWPWQESERYWIAHGRSLGWPLTNNTDGGDGVVNLPPEARARMSASSRSRRASPETRAKISASWARRVVSEETKAKMRRAHAGRVITWGSKLSESLRKLTAEQESEIRKRLSAGERVSDVAREFGMHRTSISKVKKGTYR